MVRYRCVSIVDFVKRASRGFSLFMLKSKPFAWALLLFNVVPASCASSAQVYQIGDEVNANNEDYMWVDRNPYFDAAMLLFNIEDTEKHDDYYLLPYIVVAFFACILYQA